MFVLSSLFLVNQTNRQHRKLHYPRVSRALRSLVTTQPTYGGRRWWFLCPLARNDGGPPRRLAKLYLPPGGRYFGSRQAYGLTYTSCRESGKFEGLYRRLAAHMGTDPSSIRHALRRL